MRTKTPPRRVPAVLLLSFLALPGGLPAAAGPPTAGLRVAAVQLEVRPAAYASLEAFRGWIASRVEDCLPDRPDLIVFPEYAAVFVALIPHPGVVRASASLEEGWRALRREEPLAGSLRELFLLNSGFTERVVREVFGGLARRHGVAILAGSFFAAVVSQTTSPAGTAPTRSADGTPPVAPEAPAGTPLTGTAGGVELRNRALLFGPDGGELYRQDKVFLTEFETGLLGLSPGSLEQPFGFDLRGRRVALTLCRDTFHREWEAIYRACDLWLDIKANGTAYTPEEAESFRLALPARLGPAEVPYGLTVCLNGRFLDLFWEGPSSLITAGEGGGGSADGTPAGDGGTPVRQLRSARSPRREEILTVVLP